MATGKSASGAARRRRPGYRVMEVFAVRAVPHGPFEGVDVRVLNERLLDLVRNGATILITTHVLEVVERFRDHMAIINQGRVVIQGTVTELRTCTETLEDAFVRIVGAERATDSMGWL